MVDAADVKSAGQIGRRGSTPLLGTKRTAWLCGLPVELQNPLCLLSDGKKWSRLQEKLAFFRFGKARFRCYRSRGRSCVSGGFFDNDNCLWRLVPGTFLLFFVLNNGSDRIPGDTSEDSSFGFVSRLVADDSACDPADRRADGIFFVENPRG